MFNPLSRRRLLPSIGRNMEVATTYPFIRRDHTDLSPLASEFSSIKLDYSSLGVFLQRVGDVADTFGLAAFLLGRNEAMSDRTDEGEVREEVGGGRGVGQGGDENGRTGRIQSI